MFEFFIKHIEIINLINYVVVGVDFFLVVIIVVRGWRKVLNLLFSAVTLSVAFWAMAIVGFYSREFLFDINWILWTHTFALFVSLFFLYFSLFYPKTLIQNKSLLILPILPVIFIEYLIFNTSFIIGNTIGIEYEIDIGYLFYSAILLGYVFTTYVILFLQYHHAKDILIKNQVKYLLIGYTTASLLASFCDLLLPYFEIFEFTWLGPFFTLILVMSIFFNIVRFNLFNIKIIVAELFSVILIFVLIFELFFSDSRTELLAKAGILTFVVIFIFQFIKSVYKEVRTREQLAVVNKELEQLNLEKSEFLSLATHQLRAPLTVIKGYTSMLMEGSYGKLEQKASETAQKVFDMAENLVILIDDYLNISRIEQGRMKYDVGPVDIKKLIMGLVQELHHLTDAGKTELYFHIKKEGDYTIQADIGKIRQVITNVIDNALKYTKAGSVNVYLDKVGDDTVRIEVKDTGVGMSKETIAHLFRRFSRAKDVGKTEKSGSGLGLYIAHEMVQAHNGHIWAESEGEGKGSLFMIELPVNKPPRAEVERNRAGVGTLADAHQENDTTNAAT